MVKAFDQYRNERTVGGDDFRSHLRGPVDIDCYVADLSYGEYIVAYQADVSGAYNLSVTLTQGGATRHIKGSMFALRVVPERPTVTALSPRSGPITGDTLMSFSIGFQCPGAVGCAPVGGPRSREDFVEWLDYLGTRNMTLRFTGWDGLDVDGDPHAGATHLSWELQGWYNDDDGTVQCLSRDFYRDVYDLGRVPHPGETSYSTVELKAESMEYTTSGTQFYYYAIPVRVTYFSPHTGPDSGYTAVSVEGVNMVQNDVTDVEVRCKFGDQVGPQATFVPGTGARWRACLALCGLFNSVPNLPCAPAGTAPKTLCNPRNPRRLTKLYRYSCVLIESAPHRARASGILLCLSGDYRAIAHASCDENAHHSHEDACPKVIPVPLTVALNGQQFTEPELLFEFYRYSCVLSTSAQPLSRVSWAFRCRSLPCANKDRPSLIEGVSSGRTPVEVYEFWPKSGPITGETSTLIYGLNFVDTGIIRCKWGDDDNAVAPAEYVDDGTMAGAIRCASPRVDNLDPAPYEPGYYRLEVALNGMQFSVLPVIGDPAEDYFFYQRPHVASVLPDYGAYVGGTPVALSALPGALFVQPSAVSEISCMFKAGDIKLEVPGHFDGTTGEVQCTSPPTTQAVTVRLEVALNGQQYTQVRSTRLCGAGLCGARGCAAPRLCSPPENMAARWHSDAAANARSPARPAQDLVRFAYTPLLTGLDINLGPTSGGTMIHVSGSGFVEQGAEEMMCRFTDVSGAVEDLFLPVERYIDNRTVVCRSPSYDLVDPYPYMYPATIEISLDACLACRFGNHYSESGALTTFSFYEDPVVQLLGFEPYNSGLMAGGQDLEISGQYMVTIADPMPPMFCAFLGDGIHTATMVIIFSKDTATTETVFCTAPTVDEPQVSADSFLLPSPASLLRSAARVCSPRRAGLTESTRLCRPVRAQDVAVELSLNSQQYTQSGVTFNYYDPTRPPVITNMRPKSGPKEGGERCRLPFCSLAWLRGLRPAAVSHTCRLEPVRVPRPLD
eukprot:SAG22_NODE_887_length_6660_cov_2.023929_5_plen_1010_part_00